MPWVGSTGPVRSAIVLLNLVQNMFQHIWFHLNCVTAQAGGNLQWTPVGSLCGPLCSLPWPVAWPGLASFAYPNFWLTTTDPKCTNVQPNARRQLDQSISLHCMGNPNKSSEFSVFYEKYLPKQVPQAFLLVAAGSLRVAVNVVWKPHNKAVVFFMPNYMLVSWTAYKIFQDLKYWYMLLIIIIFWSTKLKV